MIAFKPGVKIAGLSPEIAAAIPVIAAAFSPSDTIITAALDGEHKPGSLHYKGKALDLRTKHLTGGVSQGKAIIVKLKAALTDEFDVILEDDHIHVEFDPKAVKA